MADVILVLDEGTTGSQASFFSIKDFSMFANCKVDFSQFYPNAGEIEHDPEDIWQATLTAIKKALAKIKKKNPVFKLSQVAAIGVTNQRETCLAWNKKTGEVAGRAIVWQDRRTADFCQSLKNDDATRKLILQKTGLVCDPYFSASKMRWMLQHLPKLKPWLERGELALGTIDSYLIWRLTAGRSFVTDHTNASRTMLYNLHAGCYDDDLLGLFSIPPNTLPEIRASSGFFGTTLNVPDLPDGIPVTGVIGDQQAALFGHNCTEPGDSKITFGTGAFLLMHTGSEIPVAENGLLTTVAHSQGLNRLFAIEGSAFIAGAAVQFLLDRFHFVASSQETEEVALSDSRDNQLLFVPSLSGLGAPYWNPHARGVLFGLSQGTSQAQIVRAVLESIALQNVQLLSLMQETSGIRMNRVHVDGGGSRNNFLIQFQADVLQKVLFRPANTETTSLGAAKVAFLGLYSGEQISFSKENHIFEFSPQMEATAAKQTVQQWLNAADCVDRFYRTDQY